MPTVSAPVDGRAPASALEGTGVGDRAATTLRLAMVEPDSYRPDEVNPMDQGAVILTDLLYQGLTEAEGTDGVLRPGLATRWSADDEFRRWTFELDPDAGVDAATVVASLRKLIASEDRSITGGPGQSMAVVAAGLASVTAVDDRTIRVELESANAGLPWVLSGVSYSIVGAEETATADWRIRSRSPLGVVLVPRAGSGVDSRFDRIEIRWVADEVEGQRLLDGMAVDAAVVDPSLSNLADEGGGANRVNPTSTTGVRFYVVNRASRQLVDRASRIDLVGAIDGLDLVEVVGENLLPADGLVPPSVAGYQEPACPATPCGDEAHTDVGGRIAWPKDSTIVVSHLGGQQEALTEALVTEWQGEGVPVEAVVMTPGALAAAIVDGSTDVFAFGWAAPAGSIDAIVPPLLGPASPANVARQAEPELAELLERAAVTADDEDRWALLERAHRSALADADLLPVAVTAGNLMFAPDADGVTVRADGSIDLESSP